MSTEHEADIGADAEAALRERVETFLARNFPQISMHGGTAGVEAVDADAGELWLALGGACSGCGISPMTVQAIQARLPQEIPELDTVHVDEGGTGMHF
ncbi:NifU family protein [Halarchaeum sp. CBA1220]|uniref:NifU family protein n=1 Tax=Halarchaeum sp. CBA1220 TaxID=1853682 RepID=UPI000F3AA434|nr:NifU family protein [Halarchaeum sp. CBA1220]QLC34116.1 NifU family protein [Halarchaeum sp. CBA1220]